MRRQSDHATNRMVEEAHELGYRILELQKKLRVYSPSENTPIPQIDFEKLKEVPEQLKELEALKERLKIYRSREPMCVKKSIVFFDPSCDGNDECYHYIIARCDTEIQVSEDLAFYAFEKANAARVWPWQDSKYAQIGGQYKALRSPIRPVPTQKPPTLVELDALAHPVPPLERSYFGERFVKKRESTNAEYYPIDRAARELKSIIEEKTKKQKEK
jgi:hypothetical protein